VGLQNPQEFEELIRQKLPELLRRRPEFRHEIMGIMAETLATKDELAAILKRLEAHEEASRRRFEAMERRFEAMERRFEAVDRRFEALERRLEGVITDLRDLRLEVSALSGRLGRGLEDIVRQTVERFSGQKFKEVKRLVLQDEAGELYGVPAEVEFDLYLADDLSWVVEVKSHVKTGDVLNFYRKKLFAEAQLGRPLKGLLISASIDRQAKKRCRELGLEVMCRAVVQNRA